MKKIHTALVLIIVTLAIIGLFVGNYFLGRIPENPAGTVGNTAGNLINNGLFCESDGVVYFANPYDQNTLYSMNPDETEVKKIGNVGVQSINAGGDFLYYYQKNSGSGSGLGFVVRTTGVYRIKKDGSDALCLKRDPAAIITLIDNNIYYQHYTDATGTTLDRISIDKSSEETVFPSMISPASVVNSTIYYTNPEKDHYLYSYDTRYGNETIVWNHRVWNPIYQGDYIYFMDIDTDYELHRYNPYTLEEEVLTTDRVDTYNIYGDYIYYQKNSPTEPALMRMRTDGSELEVVAYGNFQNINITSNYVYFNAYDEPTPIYRQPLWGPVNVTTFHPQAEN